MTPKGSRSWELAYVVSVVGLCFPSSATLPPSQALRRADDIQHVVIGIKLSKDDLLIASPCVQQGAACLNSRWGLALVVLSERMKNKAGWPGAALQANLVISLSCLPVALLTISWTLNCSFISGRLVDLSQSICNFCVLAPRHQIQLVRIRLNQ